MLDNYKKNDLLHLKNKRLIYVHLHIPFVICVRKDNK